MARRFPRVTFVRTAVSGAALVTLNGVTGSFRRLIVPARTLAASAGTLIGNIKNLGPDGAIDYTDPTSGDPALVIPLPGGKVVSFDAVCTHAGCTVAYDPTQQLLICPCHGSTYDPSRKGKVVVGPATDPLASLPIRVDATGNVYALDAQPAPTPTPGAAGRWVSYDPESNTARLTVVAAYGADADNFNGGKKGQFVFTVPRNATVILTFSNASPHARHGLKIVPYKQAILHGGKLPGAAFPGAASPHASKGTKGGGKQTLVFRADRPGRYILVCPVHDHIQKGQWDWLIVSDAARTATGTLTS